MFFLLEKKNTGLFDCFKKKKKKKSELLGGEKTYIFRKEILKF